jgi:hypothetical protein
MEGRQPSAQPLAIELKLVPAPVSAVPERVLVVDDDEAILELAAT